MFDKREDETEESEKACQAGHSVGCFLSMEQGNEGEY